MGTQGTEKVWLHVTELLASKGLLLDANILLTVTITAIGTKNQGPSQDVIH